MSHLLRTFTLALALFVTSVIGTVLSTNLDPSGTAHAAAGAPPSGPISPPKTGAELKHACGQGILGFSDLEGERVLREMLIVQCRAMVAAIVELVNGGQYAIEDTPVWKCVKNREDQTALAATYVKWVGRRPALMRKPAAVAFVEAIEMSERCRN